MLIKTMEESFLHLVQMGVVWISYLIFIITITVINNHCYLIPWLFWNRPSTNAPLPIIFTKISLKGLSKYFLHSTNTEFSVLYTGCTFQEIEEGDIHKNCSKVSFRKDPQKRAHRESSSQTIGTTKRLSPNNHKLVDYFSFEALFSWID